MDPGGGGTFRNAEHPGDLGRSQAHVVPQDERHPMVDAQAGESALDLIAAVDRGERLLGGARVHEAKVHGLRAAPATALLIATGVQQ